MKYSQSPAAVYKREYRERLAARTDSAVVPASGRILSRLDGWGNIMTGMGDEAYDRKMSTSFNPEFKLPEQLLINLITYSGLFRKTIMLPIYDALRKWFTVEGDTDNLIANEAKRLSIRTAIHKAWWNSRTFGGAIMVIHANDGRNLDEPLDENNIREIESLRVYSRWRSARLTYYMDKNDPRYSETETFTISPQMQFTTSFVVHESRCLIFDGIDIPPQIRAQNQWWGDSQAQQIFQVLSQLGEAFNNVSHILGEYTMLITKVKNLTQKIAMNGGDQVIARAQIVNLTRSIMGTYLLDADGEDARRETIAVSGLSDLLEVLMMRYAADAWMPVRKLFGSKIAGTGGIGDQGNEETRDYYDYCTAIRNDECEPQVERLIRLLMLQKKGPFGGKELKGWKVVWLPLLEEPMKDQITNKKTQADIDNIYWQMGSLGEDEIRDSRFGGDTYSHDTHINAKAPAKSAGLEDQQAKTRGDSGDGLNIPDTGTTSLAPLNLPDVYRGFVNVSHNQLTSLYGSPRRVEGMFSVNGNPLIDLTGAPEYTEDFHCPSCKDLKTLTGAPRDVTDLHCHDCPQLINFIGGPAVIRKDVHAYGCKITSMEGLPEEIGGDLLLNNNNLTTLDHLPKKVGRNLDLSDNPVKFDESEIRSRCQVGGMIKV